MLRVISAVTLLPLVILLLVLGGVWSAGLLGVAAAICAGEYYAITQQGHLSPLSLLGCLGAGAMPFVFALAPGRANDFAFWGVAGYLLLSWGYYLIRGPLSDAPTRVAHHVTGLLYGGVGLSALAALRILPEGFSWVISALTITWVNDTAAYFAGRFLGRHKLYPEVSPNKTWEGFFGGMLGSILGMFVARAGFFPHFTVVDCLVVGLLGGVVGPTGDLCESMLKRAYQVKDSGRVIPGHGGLLDRIDALIFNAPMVFVYVTFLRR